MCSEAVPCDGILMQDIYLVRDSSSATCSYAKATVVQLGYNFPFCSTDVE
jgi:polygalacturonase